jgi:hypothetical protein
MSFGRKTYDGNIFGGSIGTARAEKFLDTAGKTDSMLPQKSSS